MCKVQNAIVLANDVELVAEPDGDKLIYWSGQQLSLAGASALLVSVEILKATDMTVRLIGQYGCDGTSWYPLGPDGYIDGTTAGINAATTKPYLYVFTCRPSLLANFVRLGISAEGVGSARATISVRPLHMPAQEVAKYLSSVTSGVPTVILPEMDVVDYDSAQIFVTLGGTATGNMDVTAYGGPVLGDSRVYLGTVQIATGATSGYLALQMLPRTLEVKTSGTAAPAGGAVTTQVVLKAAR